MSFQKTVFLLAVKKAKEIRAKNPNLTVAEATKKAWQTPEVLKAKEDWQRKKAASLSGPAKKPAAKKKAAKKKAK
jgi:hypothetical protein